MSVVLRAARAKMTRRRTCGRQRALGACNLHTANIIRPAARTITAPSGRDTPRPSRAGQQQQQVSRAEMDIKFSSSTCAPNRLRLAVRGCQSIGPPPRPFGSSPRRRRCFRCCRTSDVGNNCFVARPDSCLPDTTSVAALAAASGHYCHCVSAALFRATRITCCAHQRRPTTVC